MDYDKKYKLLFDLIKNHKYKEFEKELNEIDPNDPIFDINTRDELNNYLLTYTVTINNIDMTKLLIQKGARIDVADKNDRSLLTIPIMYSYYDTLKLLLETNKNTIGISIIDMRDKMMRTPLHIAIEVKNVEAIKILLEFGANPNAIDKDGNNGLHLSIKSRMLQICELIVINISDINSRINTGESALHIACNLQLIEIAKLLIKHRIDINAQDYTHEISPLHYAVLLSNRELVDLLMKNNVNVNLQDIYGNTPVHYCVIENNFEALLTFIRSKYKNIINLNMWNIEGEIPLHIILRDNTGLVEKFSNIYIENNTNHIQEKISVIDYIIEKSNLSLQDNYGNSCLYYLVMSNLWKKYKNILSLKRLDIFSINSKKENVYDIIPHKDKDEFIDIVVESYIHRLKTAGELWYEEWENICSKDFLKLDKEDKLKINAKNTNSFDLVCKDMIKKKIKSLIKKIQSKELVSCYEKSFPMKNATVCIDIPTDENLSLRYCTFTGSTLDILIGLIYLLKKHKDVCSTLSRNYAKNKELCAFYKSIGIIMNNKCEFLNFEIVWVNQRLYLIEGFYENFKKCITKGSKYIIIPLGIEMREGNHSGYLIYDSTTNEVERFEPHGATTPPGLYYNPGLLDDLLEKRFKTIDEDIKYVRPSEYIPKIGFQLFDAGESKHKKIGDPLGFCALWSIWYVDMRLTYRLYDRKKLIDLLIKVTKSQNISFKNMIRNYGKHIIEIRDKILLKSQMDINDWLNDQYTDIQINSVLDELNKEIENII